jgi:chemotaxis protein MotB
MLATARLLACLAPLALAALSGCALVSKSRLDAAQTQNRALVEKNRALTAEVANLKVHGDNLLDKLERTEEELAVLQEEAGLDGSHLADFRRQRGRLQESYVSLLGGRAPIGPETRNRLAEISRRWPALHFDPATGISKLDTDILFDSGKAELKPGAEELLGQLARVLNAPEAGDLKVLVAGHTDDRKIAKKPGRDKYRSNFDLSADRALAVCDRLRALGLHQERMAMAGFGGQQPVAPNVTPADRRKNRRVEIFVMAPEVPIVGWTETTPTLY